MSRGKWENKGRSGWEYTGHGWGVYRVQRTRNGWYAAHVPFGGSPVGLGMHGTREAAQSQVERIVDELAASKARKGNPVAKLKWPHTYAGGTGAAEGRHGYRSEATPFGYWTVQPISWPNGRHRGYVADFVNDKGAVPGGLHQRIGGYNHVFRSAAKAKAAASDSYGGLLVAEGVRKGNPVKKRRSAAQRAATAKMIAANKARRGNPRKRGKRIEHFTSMRVAGTGYGPSPTAGLRLRRKRRKPRAQNPARHAPQYIIAIRRNTGAMEFYTGRGYGPRNHAAHFQTPEIARQIAGTLGHRAVVAPYSASTREIRAFLLTGKH